MENLKCKALSQSKEVLLFLEVDFFWLMEIILFLFSLRHYVLRIEPRVLCMYTSKSQVIIFYFFTFSYVSMCISVHFRGGSERGQSN